MSLSMLLVLIPSDRIMIMISDFSPPFQISNLKPFRLRLYALVYWYYLSGACEINMIMIGKSWFWVVVPKNYELRRNMTWNNNG
jgi:hypothetical protein